MIVRDYLEPQRLGLNMNAPCPVHGWPTTLVSARASHGFYEEHETALTLKTVYRGREVNEVGKARFALEPGRYLILNEGQRYAHAIEGETDVLALVFRPGMAQEMRKSLTDRCEALLDRPHDPGIDPPFFERLYPSDETLERHFTALRARMACMSLDEGQLEEASYTILSRLFEIHAHTLRTVGELPGVRYATKVELYRRLHTARDFLDASFRASITLIEVASVADLSPHHLLRSFKKVFGTTPHKYVRAKRLEEARRLLRTTEAPVTEVCFEVGFESLGSFSSLFKKEMGLSPSEYRAQ